MLVRFFVNLFKKPSLTPEIDDKIVKSIEREKKIDLELEKRYNEVDGALKEWEK